MSSKQRDALERILSVCADAEVTDCQAREIAEDVAGAALVEPVRNCDVGTAEEQAERFKKWCVGEFYKRPMDAKGEPCKSCPCYQILPNGVDGCNFLRWAQMPYEEGGAE